jgi:hypothetical protein
LPDSLAEPHRRKKRLTKKEKEEVCEWEQSRKNMFQCGHRSGVLVELWPGDIITLGQLAGTILGDQRNSFPVFARVGDVRSYEDDERVVIQPDDAMIWLQEIETIVRSLEGHGTLPYRAVQSFMVEFHRLEIGSAVALRQSIDDVAAKIPFARTVPFHDAAQQGIPDMEATGRKIFETLNAAASLCHASIKTGNPIRLLW